MYCLCRSSKTIALRIVLLDETDFLHELQDDLPGQALLDVVFARLNLIETAYFGIRYIDQDNQTHWLDPAARLSRQLKGTKAPFDLYFGVKFYACDPCKLVEEITRYQLYLQVKQDILQGRLPVSFELAAELGAYVVQAELGDYDPRKHPPAYVSEFRLLNNQTKEIENRIHELHMQLKSMSPSQAEFNYLDKVKWHDMYGVDLHPVLGEDSVEYFLGLTPGGIVVLRNKTTVAHYYWPRIAKVYFKGRYFMLRVCDKNNEISTYGFETPKKSACRHLWKCCVEHHSFFRLVRTAPMQAVSGAASLTSLSSKFRYSGRTERQQMSEVMLQQRAPPAFTRTPSRRQPRRIVDEKQEEKVFDAPKYIQQEIKSVSIPQPAQTFDSPYRSTCSIPAALNTSSKAYPAPPDSPRSTRSAPWMRSQQRGLFGINSSPKSVRSVSTRMSAPANPNRMRSSSVESHSSNESRSGRRRRHRSRRVSDNESELSRGSGRSGRSHNSHRKHRRHRSKNRRNRSDTESRDRSYSSHRRSTESIELVDSGEQWLEVQRKQADNVQKAAVIKSSQVLKGSTPDSGIVHHHRSRRHRKHRSPSEKIWSSELTKHLQFDLVDTTGMTADQLREIPYTVVETYHLATKKPNPLKVHKTSHHVNQRIDRIREYPKENVNDNMSGVNGSIRSASTISSSRDYDRNSGLIRMMSSMSMGDFISPTGSSLSPLDSSGLRVSHEHTDSGLGADQDYAYSSERSSDSAKYGTNKSSGASVNSAHTKSSSSNNMKNHHHSVSSNSTTTTTRKPPLCPGRQQKLPGPIIPGVHSTSSAPNNRLINSSNTHFQNNHYTFSLTRQNAPSGHGSRPAYGSSTGLGLNSYGYLDSAATLSSTSPYHYYYDGTGFRSAANQPCLTGIPNYESSRLGSIRGTKSDIGVPIRPKNHRHQQYITSVHNRLANGPNKRAMIPSTKTDYLENYKTGLERLKLSNNHNTGNNNSSPPETFAGLLNTSISVQNIINNNYQPASTSKETGIGSSVCNSPTSGGPTILAKGSDRVGPLVFLDSNQNRNSPGHEGQSVQATAFEEPTKGLPVSAATDSSTTEARHIGKHPTNGGGGRGGSTGGNGRPTPPIPSIGESNPTNIGLDFSRKNSLNSKIGTTGTGKRSSSLELILTPIIQSRRAQ
ncbi:band 4.1-like protein 4A isoform X1 [Wyeomyia smithii]|uniref:band 4.1-like protein 4A isoform X1 n=1 Tax=Wyeomyia smithii TaxID=174621 RepID=UPI0024680C25|nr:band 4.1-like protein 4A isoform X1 [Wyeomyia smithii]XP_055551561.1 band 4.1-like protein 4A isoform X1 [Wyeomyia smithii]